jgi:large conductance mechanosensitive channel
MLKEFREFALRGNVVDMAVGIIIGGAFGTIVQSLVNDMLMPPIGLLLGNVDFQDLFVVIRSGTPGPPYATVDLAQQAGAVTVNYGLFINSVVSFLLVAIAIFMLVRVMNRMRAERAEAPMPSTKACPHCAMQIPLAATRCPHCTSTLEAA